MCDNVHLFIHHMQMEITFLLIQFTFIQMRSLAVENFFSCQQKLKSS